MLSLQDGKLDEAIDIFRRVLTTAKIGYLGTKSECGCHYNLAIAYARKGMTVPAVSEFNKVLDTWPTMEYARYARQALDRRKPKPEEPANDHEPVTMTGEDRATGQ